MKDTAIKLGITAGMAALTFDWFYTCWFWMIKGRPHPARRYFPILLQLSVEVALVLHLREVLRQTRKVVEAVEAKEDES